MKTIVSFKALFDLSIVTYAKSIRDMTSSFADASRSWDFQSDLGAVCRSNWQQVPRLLLFKQIVDGLYLLVFQYIAAVDFVQQFARLVLLNKLCWTPLEILLKRSPSY